MVKKTIKYVDYNGLARTEDFYFNLTRSEISEMDLENDERLSVSLERAVKSPDARYMLKFIKEFILRAYGVKSDDGKRIVKSKELSEAFYQCPAYDKLLEELLINSTDGSAFNEFALGVIPAVDVNALPAR